jgi:hypothetical protein
MSKLTRRADGKFDFVTGSGASFGASIGHAVEIGAIGVKTPDLLAEYMDSDQVDPVVLHDVVMRHIEVEHLPSTLAYYGMTIEAADTLSARILSVIRDAKLAPSFQRFSLSDRLPIV